MSDILNPLKSVVSINSVNRTTGTSDNFGIDFSDQISTDVQYDSCVLLNCSIPKSFYTITDLNNTFLLIEGASEFVVTIEIGNYSFDTLKTELQTQLNNAGAFTYSVSKLTKLSAYRFTVSGNAGVQPTFRFTNLVGNYDISYVIGFSQADHTFTADILDSSVVNIQYTNSIYVMSDLVRSNNGVLALIFSDVQNNSFITYHEASPAYVSKFANVGNAKYARFWLLDQFGNRLSLNGLDWQLTILLYRRDNYNMTMLRNLQYEEEHKKALAAIQA